MAAVSSKAAPEREAKTSLLKRWSFLARLRRQRFATCPVSDGEKQGTALAVKGGRPAQAGTPGGLGPCPLTPSHPLPLFLRAVVPTPSPVSR